MLDVKRGNLKEAERKPEAKLKYNSQYEPSSQRKGIYRQKFPDCYYWWKKQALVNLFAVAGNGNWIL